MPDVCDRMKERALQALPDLVAATAISALALCVSITLTRQVRSNIIKTKGLQDKIDTLTQELAQSKALKINPRPGLNGGRAVHSAHSIAV